MNKKAVGLLIGSGLVLLLCFLAALGIATGSPKTLIGKTFIVNSTGDTDDGSCGSGFLADCTLREAINAANTNVGPDTIEFNIDTKDPGYNAITGTWTITLTTGLPPLTDDGTTIDGSTQAAFIGGDPNPDGPEIEISGAAVPSGDCLDISSANNVIHGLVINRCPSSGIQIWGSGATTNTISGNYIGTDATGSSGLGNGGRGVVIDGGAQNNVIGGDAPGERNLISGNDQYGVYISDSGTDGNTVSGNYIGTDATGSSDLGNAYGGVSIEYGAQNITIGGATSGAGNVISGNDGYGVQIYGSGANGNIVSGNYIGTDATGSLDLGNAYGGVFIQEGAQNNVIGGDAPEERNIISGNDQDGVRIHGSGTMSNTISGNYVGTDASGALDLGNAYDGVLIHGGAQNNVIGGQTEAERNIISGNHRRGVSVGGSGTDGNTVSGNYIGTDVSGSSPLGNDWDGVFICDDAQHNVIGGDSPGERNVISGNDWNGVRIDYSGTMSNTVSGNYIGTDATGSLDLGNAYSGVSIEDGAQNNVIGGQTEAERNIISGNHRRGVFVGGSGTDGNTVSGNYIGTDVSGSSDLGNDWDGVLISGGAQNNVIGGNTPGESNIIAFSGEAGVHVDDATTTGNTITQNSIHSNVGLGIELSNGGNGGIGAPAISSASCVSISGTAPANATVEVFTGPDDEGKTYLTTVSSDGGGDWSAPGPFTLDAYVTATATDASGNTSEFSTEVTPGTCYQIFLPLMVKNY